MSIKFRLSLTLAIACGFVCFRTPVTVSADTAIVKKTFDFVIGVDGDFKAALTAAKSAAAGKRFYIFFPNGEYNIGTLTGNSNQMTTFTTSNVSFIGQSADSTVIFNKSVNEGIGITSTLCFSNANNLYLQDLTILNKANYGDASTYSMTGRHVAVMEQGNDIIYKNVKLLSTQDTYYTKGKRTYWENGEIHGTTDFICGGGDVLFNRCLIYTDRNSTITAPATTTSWGYVFLDCTIDGSISTYNLGRSWSNQPRCVFVNTTMKKIPSAAAWGDPMNVVPALFAEYNSKTASGSPVDLSKRRTTYTKGATTVTLNPRLTAEQAAKYTTANIMGDWKPDLLTAQLSAPVLMRDGTTISWNDNNSALCYVVFKNGKYYKCVTSNSCDIASDTQAKYTVRSANQMGGLGPVSVPPTSVSMYDDKNRHTPRSLTFDPVRKTLCIHFSQAGNLKVTIISLNGRTLYSGELILNSGTSYAEIHLNDFKSGRHIIKYEYSNSVNVEYVDLF